MIDIRNPVILGLGAAVAALLVLAAAQRAQLSGERADHMRTKAAHAEQLQRIATKARAAADAAVLAQQAQQRAVAAIDAQRSKEKDDALSDNDARRARDAAGSGGLRIPANCRPAAPASLSSAAPTASVDAQAAEIPAAFRQELWDLRAALITEQAQLLALQDYVRRLAAGGNP